MSVASWRNHWDGLTAFFKYPVEFRRLIYTTNAIESLHSQMQKNIASRKVFPHDDAVIKILFLNIRNFSNRWSRRQGWDIVMNQLAVIFGDRLKAEVIDGLQAAPPLHGSCYSLVQQPAEQSALPPRLLQTAACILGCGARILSCQETPV